jgi:hypothetical protein
MGPSRFTSHPRGRCAADFIALKNPSPWPGFVPAPVKIMEKNRKISFKIKYKT